MAMTGMISCTAKDVYSYIYGIKTTGLRFFTVYGPWGRPDMALFKFVQNIIKNKKITVFNGGKMKRSFTYIDDVTLSLKKIIFKKNNPNKKLHDVLNIGGDKSVRLDRFILEIERNLKTRAKKKIFTCPNRGRKKYMCRYY